MEERAQFLIDYANEHGPVTVRGLYYQAEVHGVPGIDKTDASYAKVQRQVLALRRQDRLPYRAIADATRWMRKPRSHDSIEEALKETAALYRRNLWRDLPISVEIWLEKDALAGVIYPITEAFDVPLMVTRGFSSETFAFEAVAARQDDDRPCLVYYLGDFDRAGHDARDSLREKLHRFGSEFGVQIEFIDLGINIGHVIAHNLPTRDPKRNTAADKNWPFHIACELDAMAPGDMRALVQTALEHHLPEHEYRVLKVAEQSERELITRWAALAPEHEAAR